ncbi:MAG: hypothetical protein QOH69_3088 [Actinomycetota bacterium]|nr:hypothetical protein [Actinomycetota bacterium]
MKSTAARVGGAVAAIGLALGLTVGLTGCFGSPTSQSTDAPTSGASSASPTPSTAPTPSPTSPTTPKFVEDCATLFTSAQVYDYNPNYVADPSFAPKSGSVSAAIAANAGQTCGWVNETSKSEIEIAVATPLLSALTAAKAAASTGVPISSAGEHGYFTVKNGVGSAQFFFGSLWLSVSSADFTTATDAQGVYPTVIQNQLNAGG